MSLSTAVCAYRQDEREGWRRLTPQMVPLDPRAAHCQTPPIREGGVYLITGGLGSIGLELARGLAAAGAGTLVLMLRRGLPAEPLEQEPETPLSPPRRALVELEAGGVTVWTVAGDVGDPAFVASLLEQIISRYGALDGVIHAAGVLEDGLLCRKSLDEVRAVLWPKLQGTLVLDRLTRDRGLAFFVGFSSTAALDALPGHGSYAAANAYLDLAAQARQAAGSRALSINWGPWSGSTSASASGYRRLMQSLGTSDIPSEAGFPSLVLALETGRTQLAIIRRTWPKQTPQSINSGEFSSDWQSLVDVIHSESKTIAQRLSAREPQLNRLSSALDRLASDYVQNLLVRARLFRTRGDLQSFEQIASRLGAVGSYLPALRSLLGFLVQDHKLIQIDGQFRAPQPLEERYIETTALLAEFPELKPQLALLDRCASQLRSVLSGQCRAIELVFAGSSVVEAQAVYKASPWVSVLQASLASIIKALLLRRSDAVRVLEIGGGTGSTTAYLLEALRGRCKEYLFTDISSALTRRAKERFGGYKFFKTARFDVELPASQQNLEHQSYDLVIAADVLHATRRLAESVENVASVLRPGGVLVLVEATRALRYGQLTFGLTEGWWRFKDRDLRPDQPILSADRWLDLLRQAGFAGVVAIPDRAFGFLDHHLIFAQASRVAAKVTVTRQEAPSHRDSPRLTVPSDPLVPDERSILPVVVLLREIFAQVLQIEPNEVDPHRSFNDQGVNSLMLLEVVQALRERTAFREFARRKCLTIPQLFRWRHSW